MRRFAWAIFSGRGTQEEAKMNAEFWVNLAVLIFLFSVSVWATFEVAVFSGPLGNLSDAQKKVKKLLELLYPPS